MTAETLQTLLIATRYEEDTFLLWLTLSETYAAKSTWLRKTHGGITQLKTARIEWQKACENLREARQAAIEKVIPTDDLDNI